MSDYFPIELLNRILQNLPVKALIRFTSVCKSWQSLITSPTFISTHLYIPKNHFVLKRYDEDDKRQHYSLLKVTENGYSSSELEFPFKYKFTYFRIVGFVDGLFRLSGNLSSGGGIILWNPSIKNHVVLPHATINPNERHNFVLGLGVAGHVYKVVRLIYFNGDFTFPPPQAEVFSLRRDRVTRWRKVWAYEVRLRVCESMRCQVFLKGFVHWVAFDNCFRRSILTFQVGDEVFGEVKLPDELSRVERLHVSVIRESLVVTKEAAYGDSSDSSIDVWIMNEYGVKESWNKLYRIGSGEGFRQIFGFCRISESLWASQGNELVAYNPETREIKNLGIFGITCSFYIGNYAETLVLLNWWS